MIELIALLPCPLLIVGLALVPIKPRVLAWAAAALMGAQCAVVLLLWCPLLAAGEPMVPRWHGFRPDSTAAVFVIITTVVAAAALAHAVGFFRREAASAHPPTPRAVRVFYL